ncbi:hypothetical protein ACJX0J_022543, partial [Zea mays]
NHFASIIILQGHSTPQILYRKQMLITNTTQSNLEQQSDLCYNVNSNDQIYELIAIFVLQIPNRSLSA